MMPVPITLREANDFVEQYHRHSKRTARDGGKFAIGASDGEGMLGVAIVGLPLSRVLSDGYTAEILRVCVLPDLPPRNNVCSFLYGRCWRIWQQMGGHRMVTYTLASEPGSSLRGAGWHSMGKIRGHKDGWSSTGRERDWQPVFGQTKIRWEIAVVRALADTPGEDGNG